MSTRTDETTYRALGKLSVAEKDQRSEKSRNWKTGGYDEKAPTGSVYQN
jgi:hypothetical protein